MFRKFLLAGVAAAALTACGGAYSGGYIAVRTAPPIPRAYARPYAAPGPGYVWVDGFYDWRGSQWAWTNGHYVRPPRGRHAWVPGHHENRNGRHYWQRGYWR